MTAARRLAAILAANVLIYSRLTGEGQGGASRGFLKRVISCVKPK